MGGGIAVHTLEEIIEGLNCFKTCQHKCLDCPFNPHPGMPWPYGCIKGQNDIATEAQERLRATTPGGTKA